nr:synthetic construct [Cloning vector pUR4546]
MMLLQAFLFLLAGFAAKISAQVQLQVDLEIKRAAASGSLEQKLISEEDLN